VYPYLLRWQNINRAISHVAVHTELSDHVLRSFYTSTLVLPHVSLDVLSAICLKLLFWHINSKFKSRSKARVAWAFLLLNLPTGSAYPNQNVP
jgi:hypothetical protein